MSPSYSLFPLSNENYFCKRDLSSILIIQVARSKLFLGTLILWNKLNLFLFPFRATTATPQLCTVTRPRSRITFHSTSTFYNLQSHKRNGIETYMKYFDILSMWYVIDKNERCGVGTWLDVTTVSGCRGRLFPINNEKWATNFYYFSWEHFIIFVL